MDAVFLTQEIIRESGIMREIFQDMSPEGMSRQENVQELLNGVQEFVSRRLEEGQSTGLSDFLQEVSLLSDLDEDESDEQHKVTLMTIHSAKGLEFPVVFIVEWKKIYSQVRWRETANVHWKKNVVFFMWLLPVPNVIVI